MSSSPNRRVAAELRRRQVVDLYLQGWSQAAIAEHLGVGQTTVSLDLRILQKQWRESSIRDFDQLRTIELAKIDLVEREAWAAWQRSQKPAQSAVVNGEGPRNRARKTLKNQYGDPRFLEQVNKCIAQRRALLGLDASPPVAALEGFSDDTGSLITRRERVFALLAALGHGGQSPATAAGLDAGQSGGVRSGDERGPLETGAAPESPGPDAARSD
jgi:hypothetical protein